MAWLISVLGAVMGLAGAWSLWNGISFIRLDWGQTETVAGTVALSGGLVSLGIGAVLFALRDLRVGSAPALTTGSDTVAEPEAVTEVAAPRRPDSAVGRLRSKLSTVGMPKTEPSMAAPAEPSRDLDAPVVRPAPAPALRTEPAPVPPERAAPVPEIAPAPVPRPVPPVAEAPTVVGRYDANGATYVLFSDGTIEVETGSGTHRFDSMADLKEHIERQDQG